MRRGRRGRAVGRYQRPGRVAVAAVERPRLNARALVALLCVTLVVALALLALAAGAQAATSYDPEELAFLQLLNEHRAANGRAPLLLSDQLSLTAERHAHDMGTYGFFSHNSLQSDYYPAGFGFWERLQADGYAGASTSGENLAAGVSGAAQVFALWKDSAGHNANMLDPTVGDARVVFREVGIARVYVPGSPYGWYWATEFGGSLDPTAHDPFAAGASGGLFADVSPSYTYVEAVRSLAEAGIINGYDDGTFRPWASVWRQHFAKMIALTLDLPVSEDDVATFRDVDPSGPETLYPDNYIAAVAARGIAVGTGDGYFSPTVPITRAQVVTMVVRAVQNVRSGTLVTPPAGYLATWGSFSPSHDQPARVAEYNGLLAGLPLSSLDPWGDMTRGEVAQILSNLRERLAR